MTSEAGPWRGALLEDYELSLHLMLAGHRNEYTQDTYVDQEALPGLGRLVRQRTRWGQGTMQCGRYLRRLWASRHVSTIGALEATYYLFQPWMQVVGTLIYPIPIAVFLANYAAGPAQMRAWVISGGWMLVLLYCAFGLGPFVFMGPAVPAALRAGPGTGPLDGPRPRLTRPTCSSSTSRHGGRSAGFCATAANGPRLRATRRRGWDSPWTRRRMPAACR